MQSAKVVTYAAAETVFNSSSENVAGSSVLIDPTKSLIARFVSLFQPVLFVELIPSA